MADAWRPANELERQMQESLRIGDQEAYFRLLSDSELVVPVPPELIDEVLANETQPSWPTQEEDGRTYVLAYTSTATMRGVLGPAYKHFIKLKFGDISESWPDPRWWLAIDAGLPIEARLPSWFIKQASLGDTLLPRAGRAAAAPPEPVEPVSPVRPYTDPQAAQPAPAGYPDGDALVGGSGAPYGPPQGGPGRTDPPSYEAPYPGVSYEGMGHPPAPVVPEDDGNYAGTGPQTAAYPVTPPPGEGPEPQGYPGYPGQGGQIYETGAVYPSTGPLPVVPYEDPAGPGPYGLPAGPPAAPASEGTSGLPPTGTGPQSGIPQPGTGPLPGAEPYDRPYQPNGDPTASPAPGQHAVNPGTGPQPYRPGAIPPGAGTGGRPIERPTTGPYRIPADTDLQAYRPADPAPAPGPDPAGPYGRPAGEGTGPQAGYTAEPYAPTDPAGPLPPVQAGAPEPYAPADPAGPVPPAQAGAPEPYTPADPGGPYAPSGPVPPVQPGAPEPYTPQGEGTGPQAGYTAEPHAPQSPAEAPASPEQRVDAEDPTIPAVRAGYPGTPAAEQPAQPEQPAPRQQEPEPPAPSRRAEFRPANDTEHDLMRAASQDDHDGFVRALFASDVLLPVPDDMDFALRPGRTGFPWQTGEMEAETVVPVFTSQERLRDVLSPTGQRSGSGDPPEYVTLPFSVVVRYWPDTGWTLIVNSGTPVGASLSGDRLPALAEWADQLTAQRMVERFEPQNEVEQRLLDAASQRDADTFLNILLGSQVLVAAEPDTPWGIGPDDPEFPWGPVQAYGKTSVQVFTSLKWMHEAIGSSRFVMPNFQEMAQSWPDPSWTLVLNPGTPINTTLPGDQVRALAPELPDTNPVPVMAPPEQETAAPGPARLQAVPDPEPEFEPGNRIDQELYEAAVSGDSDAFLRVLLAANVLVPIPADAPLEVTPTLPGFRWDAAMRDVSSVHVFTSLVRLREVLPASRFVYADFRELIAAWPQREWAMLLNPGTRIGASLRGDQVLALSEWAVRVGLIPARTEPPVPQAAPESLMAAPVRTETQAAPDPYANGRPEPYEEQASAAGQPTIMQKVLPHGHVGWYLEQGYDRVGGFVHPVGDVTDLQTPAQLYEALGLLYEDSPFALEDEGAYVIRWPAYCDGLYRIPFGGGTEEDLRAWGDAGWVIERPPFQGSGFAPGSAGSIREYKVDSARLPYGAEMYYIGRDRSEQFVAMYDPDRLQWLRPAADNGSPGWTEPAEANQ